MKTKLDAAFLIALVLCISSCFESEARTPAVLNIETIRKETGSASQGQSFFRDACLATDGEWRAGLLSCNCAKGKVFTQSGCIHAELSSKVKECAAKAINDKSCNQGDLESSFSQIYKNLNVSVDLKNLSTDETAALLIALAENPGFLLKGWSIPFGLTETKMFVEFSKFDQEDLKSIYWVDFGPGAITSKIMLMKANLNSGAQNNWIGSCREGLAAIFGVMSANQYCDDLYSELQVVLNTVPNAEAKTKFVENGFGCLPDCKLIKYWDGRQSEKRLDSTIHMREYVPFKRAITLHDANLEVKVYLNGLGEIEGVVAAKVEMDTSDAVLVRELRSFDGNWNPIEVTKTRSGNAQVYGHALQGHQNHDSRVVLFPFEDPQFDQPGAVRMMLIDSGVSIQNPLFLGRLSVPQSPLSAESIAGTLNEYVLINEKESHGTQMASILLKNLPDAKLSSFFYGIDSKRTPEQWIREIKTSGAQIVNMSFSLAESGFECDVFFEKVFQSLPDVLFVVASGNTGTLNPDTCPAKLGTQRRFRNVLTVAGVASNIRLDPQSSFGNEVANIAAPYSSSCVKTDGVGEDCFGTSVSAAIISNLAARIMIRNPKMSASEVAIAFQESCIPLNWPVTCGGPVNFKMLDLGVFEP